MNNPIKILIVDESALIRKVLKDIFNEDAMLKVVGTSSDIASALQKIKELQPDILTLDLDIPNGDGLAILERLLKLYPIPVVLITTLPEEETNKALTLGVVAVIAKPKLDVREKLGEIAAEIVAKVKAVVLTPTTPTPQPSATVRKQTVNNDSREPTIIAIGASTGGVDALYQLLAPLPEDTPAILVVQHMLSQFTASFAQRLNRVCQMHVEEAQEGQEVRQGRILIAPGGRHMVIERENDHYRIRIQDGPLVHRVRPSVDVLFHSMASQVGAKGIGIILTGMGSDGAKGLLAMKQSGARTLAQDEASCIVFGMPKMAIKAGAVDQVLALADISERLLALVNENSPSGNPS